MPETPAYFTNVPRPVRALGVYRRAPVIVGHDLRFLRSAGITRRPSMNLEGAEQLGDGREDRDLAVRSRSLCPSGPDQVEKSIPTQLRWRW